MKRKVIDFNSYQYNRLLDLEAKAIDTYDKLKAQGEQALGIDKVNMVEMLKKHPANYLVNEYYELYLKGIYPEHLDKENLFLQQVNISIEAINQLKIQFDGYVKELGKYAPTFNNAGITSNIKKQDFNIYLNKNKEAHYNALENLIDCIDELKTYGSITPIHLTRAFNGLVMDGVNVKIDTQKFI